MVKKEATCHDIDWKSLKLSDIQFILKIFIMLHFISIFLNNWGIEWLNELLLNSKRRF